MDAKQHKEDFTIARVEFKEKAKSCGKENCEQCPHGPYWYAYAPSYFTKNGRRLEVYLGPKWDHNDLLKKVAPKLDDNRRDEFEEEIQRILDAERLREIQDARRDIAQNIEQIKRDAEARIKQLTQQNALLAKEQAELSGEIHPKKNGRKK